MSKYTSDALITRKNELDETLGDYLGDEASPQSKQTKQAPQQQIKLSGSESDMLLQLHEYLQKGAINQQQFDQMKKQILGL
jgi:hypothetical protein